MLYTIGHSTHPLEEFAALLQEHGVDLLLDIRTVPRSRTNPQFNLDALPTALAPYQIGYEHLAALGGLRGRQRALPTSPNTFWENQSFRNYADYALTPAFRDGLARLRHIGTRQRTAFMCAEAVWWRCHRRIIADYLLADGEAVFHILGPGSIKPATLTPSARRVAEGLVYDGTEE